MSARDFRIFNRLSERIPQLELKPTVRQHGANSNTSTQLIKN